ncbi:hypothetical protein HMPREF9593_00890 [Cutibacterium acnes HL046PA2]|nr:hypothetical protein HMPREF9593_00890 [Cutibacterium acnes HL046PA2]
MTQLDRFSAMQTRDDEANLDTHPTPDQGVLFLKTKCSTLG